MFLKYFFQNPMLGIFKKELKIKINYWKFTSKGFLNFIKTVFQNTEGRTFFFPEKSQSLLKTIFFEPNPENL